MMNSRINQKFQARVAMLRPRQWVKQLLILLPLISLGAQIDFRFVNQAVFALLSFTCVAASIYIFNDLNDFESDRLDEVKKQRSIASATVSKREAYLWLACLFMVGFGITFLIGNSRPIQSMLLIYFVLNFCYSKFKLKNNAILGISIVAFGYPVRFLFGTFTFNLKVSYWAILLLSQLALVMLCGKRFQTQKRSFLKLGNQVKDEHDFWLLSMVFLGAMLGAGYIGFISDPVTQLLWGKNFLFLSCIPVGLGLIRYLEIVTHPEKFKSEDATDLVSRDKTTLIILTIYLFTMFLGRSYAQ